MTTRAKATVADLCRVPDNRKAEIVGGEVVLMSPTGSRPGRASFSIAAPARNGSSLCQLNYSNRSNGKPKH